MKYKLVASHTARKSFCTNAYKSGMPRQDIMAISSHKSERVFLNYVKVEKAEYAKRIVNMLFLVESKKVLLIMWLFFYWSQ